ncbi:RsfA family transcriptional regulator [Texcoconibacillus texcoconensis]|uniref:Chromosome segregation ATPase n=1 Tax=Texcoconibacillus texcoconensis TaxID=1095777 RepID=A0A840QLF1_9BACI|nr:chromosome segregation ATPase [Texcoconibacillus texcoconensis]
MVRQDAWSKDEDLLLAEVVLRHIREGGTQLAAFEEVARKLSRTSAACGFRWNSTIRKQYKSAIARAKEDRKKWYASSEDDTPPNLSNSESGPDVSTDDSEIEEALVTVIEFLEKQRQKLNEEGATTSEEDLRVLRDTVENLQNEKNNLESELERLRHRYQDLEQRYHLLIQAMKKATSDMDDYEKQSQGG